MAEQVLIEDGQERILTDEQAECLGARKLICRCPPCGPNIWHFKDEATSFEEVDHVLSVLDGRKSANASGQAGEDVGSICAAYRAGNDGVAVGVTDPQIVELLDQHDLPWRSYPHRYMGFARALLQSAQGVAGTLKENDRG